MIAVDRAASGGISPGAHRLVLGTTVKYVYQGVFVPGTVREDRGQNVLVQSFGHGTLITKLVPRHSLLILPSKPAATAATSSGTAVSKGPKPGARQPVVPRRPALAKGADVIAVDDSE